jgi:biotin/methionine sulfoxide reductase
MDRRFVPHHSHWGAFNAFVENRRVVSAVPLDFDPDPSPLIEAIPVRDAFADPRRATNGPRSMAAERPTSGVGCGREPFVPVERGEALNL